MTLLIDLNKEVVFANKNNTFELLDHHHELNQKKTDIIAFLC